MNHYALSDLHGFLELYYQAKDHVKPEDIIYFLGDAGDRGPQPWETIKVVAKDPQIVYIKGNHEDMLVKAAKEALDPDGYFSEAQRLLACNGGMDTLYELLNEENVWRWINHLNSLPVNKYYTNANNQKILLCHAGTSLFANDPDSLPTGRELMWDRLHYYDNSDLLSSTIVVHGHTYINHLKEDIGLPTGEIVEALRYAEGKKYCIDAGSYRNRKALLLNLDTFESTLLKL